MDSGSLQRQKLRIMKVTSGWLAVIALFISIQLHGQDITENKFGKGIVNVIAKDSSYSLKMGLRMQSLFTSDWGITELDGLGEGESAFLIRRARLKFQGYAYSSKLEYKFQLGLSNRDIAGGSEFTRDTPRLILDAVVMWNFHENFELWVGQTKLPGNREQLISSGSLETVDRSLVNSIFNLGREMGVQLHHQFSLGGDFLVKEAISVSQGEGRNVTSGNIGGYLYMGRIEFLPFGDFNAYSGADFDRETTPKLALGASYGYNNDAVQTNSNTGDYLVNDIGFYQTDISTFFLDAMFKYRGFSLMGEYGHRSAEDAFAKNSSGTLTGDVVSIGEGFNVQAGYLFPGDYQVVGRYTTIGFDDQITAVVEDQYTLALSKYIVGHKLKIQTDLSYTDLNLGLEDGLTYRLQLELQL